MGKTHRKDNSLGRKLKTGKRGKFSTKQYLRSRPSDKLGETNRDSRLYDYYEGEDNDFEKFTNGKNRKK